MDKHAQRKALRALSSSALVRELFATTITAGAHSNLSTFRAMAARDLVQGLLDENPRVHGACKQVLVERMAAIGIDDIVEFIRQDRQGRH
jgi:hypothetical protein